MLTSSVMKLDIPQTLSFHGITFNRVVCAVDAENCSTRRDGGIYKSEELKDDLYLDTDVRRMGPAGDRVKVQILVNHLVVMESKLCKKYEDALCILEGKTKPFLKLHKESQ